MTETYYVQPEEPFLEFVAEHGGHEDFKLVIKIVRSGRMEMDKKASVSAKCMDDGIERRIGASYRRNEE